MSSRPGPIVHRIVVALDASPASLSALDAAVDLAERTQGEVLGVFVEDVNLVRVGRLAFAPHVSLPSGERDELDEAWVEAQLRSLEARAGRALRAALERTRVPGAFRVVRGSVTREVLAAAGSGELLILGCASRPLTSRPRIGRTARAAAEEAVGPVLLLPEGARLGGPVVVIYDIAGEDALGASARLPDADLLVLAASTAPGEAAERARRASRALEILGVEGRVRPVWHDDAVRLRRILCSEPKGLLVVGAGSPLLTGAGLVSLLEDAASAVLIARRGKAPD
jgi:hypothetical protein